MWEKSIAGSLKAGAQTLAAAASGERRGGEKEKRRRGGGRRRTGQEKEKGSALGVGVGAKDEDLLSPGLFPNSCTLFRHTRSLPSLPPPPSPHVRNTLLSGSSTGLGAGGTPSSFFPHTTLCKPFHLDNPRYGARRGGRCPRPCLLHMPLPLRPTITEKQQRTVGCRPGGPQRRGAERSRLRPAPCSHPLRGLPSRVRARELRGWHRGLRSAR